MESVSRKRRWTASLVALLAFGANVAWAVPTLSARTVRAQWCCSSHCGHARSTGAATRCCKVGRADADLATPAQPAPPDGGLASVAAWSAIDTVSALGAPSRVEAIPAPRVRGAPLFLLTQSLRI